MELILAPFILWVVKFIVSGSLLFRIITWWIEGNFYIISIGTFISVKLKGWYLESFNAVPSTVVFVWWVEIQYLLETISESGLAYFLHAMKNCWYIGATLSVEISQYNTAPVMFCHKVYSDLDCLLLIFLFLLYLSNAPVLMKLFYLVSFRQAMFCSTILSYQVLDISVGSLVVSYMSYVLL